MNLFFLKLATLRKDLLLKHKNAANLYGKIKTHLFNIFQFNANLLVIRIKDIQGTKYH